MAQNWDYADLSKAAKAAGGPEKYVQMLEHTSRDAGKMEMLPWMGVVAVGASLITAMAIKAHNCLKSRKQRNQQEIEMAKYEIVQGIRAYDAEHEELEDNQRGE